MKLKTLSLIAVVAIIGLVGVVPVLAQTSTVITDEHIAKIKSNCQLARASLSQIHANDAPVYINRNQTYFSIGDKMMATLNSRLSLNRYDASQLVKTASDYNDSVGQFRNTYRMYDNAMTTAINTDCTKQPASFYDNVAAAREARQKVHDVIVKLTSDIHKYRSEVQTFKVKNLSSSTERRP